MKYKNSVVAIETASNWGPSHRKKFKKVLDILIKI